MIKLRFTYSEEFRLFIKHELSQVFQDNSTVKHVIKESKQEMMKTKTEQNGSIPQPKKIKAITDGIIRVKENQKLEREKKFKLESNHAQGNCYRWILTIKHSLRVIK